MAVGKKEVGAMTNVHEIDELNRLIQSAEELHKQRKYTSAEEKYKAALDLPSLRTSSRFHELNALLSRLYAETNQTDKLHSVLNDQELIAFFTSKAGSQCSSAIINTWLKAGYYAEARKLAVQLMPNLQWVPEQRKPVVNPYGGRSCGGGRTASEWIPSYNLRVWSETCNANGKPEEAERLFDECIDTAVKTRNQHTEQYVLITSLAAIQSLQLEHFEKVNSYFETAFTAGKDMVKPPYWELFSAAQKLLPKNLDMASRFYDKLLPYAQDKVYELTIKLDLATAFAKHKQIERAKSLAHEVDKEIRSDIKASAVETEYDKYIHDILNEELVDAKVTALLEKLNWFPRAAYYENGFREISDLTVLRALQWNATRTGDSAHEQNLLKMELDLLGDTVTRTLVRKVHIYKRLAQLERNITPESEDIAADFEEKAKRLNQELKETRGSWVP
jgi:hypothetical protein